MARKKEWDHSEEIINDEVKEIKSTKKENKRVKITKNTLSVYRLESELEKYLDDGWYVNDN